MAKKNPCFYCGRSTHKPRQGHRISEACCTTDHLTPRSRGGTSAPDNVVIACRACNMDKNDLTLEEYRLVLAYQQGLIGPTYAIRFAGEQWVEMKTESLIDFQCVALVEA